MLQRTYGFGTKGKIDVCMCRVRCFMTEWIRKNSRKSNLSWFSWRSCLRSTILMCECNQLASSNSTSHLVLQANSLSNESLWGKLLADSIASQLYTICWMLLYTHPCQDVQPVHALADCRKRFQDPCKDASNGWHHWVSHLITNIHWGTSKLIHRGTSQKSVYQQQLMLIYSANSWLRRPKLLAWMGVNAL